MHILQNSKFQRRRKRVKLKAQHRPNLGLSLGNPAPHNDNSGNKYRQHATTLAALSGTLTTPIPTRHSHTNTLTHTHMHSLLKKVLAKNDLQPTGPIKLFIDNTTHKQKEAKK
ncbi:uncharacterized protein LOC108606829 [Drosophila busckii]|uniref:uncharacterized protein LOC108606829 n=1 Tax=Drosophila busckii TaxID=30019 RepID=UPI00083EA0EA|nr:uncharacterized protein LOC108606829 [Drosophila busckii]